jgi:hypothetical protein
VTGHKQAFAGEEEEEEGDATRRENVMCTNARAGECSLRRRRRRRRRGEVVTLRSGGD